MRRGNALGSDKALAIEFDERRIDAIFAELDQCHLPGAAVGIAIGGTPVYRKGFGLANMELPVVLSPTIRMRIASTTKHFTSLAYMLLCEDGRAGIDDRIGTYLPELHPVTHKVTARQLMGNVSGLRDAHDICWRFSGTGRPISSASLLSLYRDMDDVNADPGTSWIYNNGGFLILSVAIERITGKSLEDVFRERIFEPVGMHDTMLRRWDTDFMPNSATLHMMNPPLDQVTLHMVNPAGDFEKSYLGTASAGEGGVVSTVHDMLRWLAHIDAPVVGSTGTWETMKAPQTLANGTSTGYGLGLVIARYRGIETLYHPGGWMGGNAQMLKVPAAGLDVVIMVNRHDVLGVMLAKKILDACLPGLDPVTAPSSHPLASGIFRSPTTGRVIQLRTSPTPWSKEAQQVASIDGTDTPVQPDYQGVLWPTGGLDFVKQSLTLIGDPAKPTSIRLSDFGNLDELVAVEPAKKINLRAVAGRYRSDATGTEATISETDDCSQLTMVGRFGSVVYELECLADGIWRAKSSRTVIPPSGLLSFDSDGGVVRFSSSQTRALPFRRCT